MRSNLEIFLLALLQADLHTPYDMMSKADISLGSSLPALERLAEAGLVQVSLGESRATKLFTLTDTGTITLENEWKRVVADTGNDVDSIIRAATLLWIRGEKEPRSECGKFLNDRAAVLKKETKKKRSKPRVTADQLSAEGGLRDRYRWFRISVQESRREAEIATLFELSREIWPPKSRKKKDTIRDEQN
jgi:DNA-binding PadR family transcriptional regulator